MTVHRLPFERATLHGHFSRDLLPVLRIADGDTVHFTTFDPSWRYDPLRGIRDPDFARDPELDRVLASQAIAVIRQALQLRHKRRPPWNIF